MNNIYNIGKVIQMKENDLYKIKININNLLNQENINWVEINNQSNKSLIILDNLVKLRHEKIESIINF